MSRDNIYTQSLGLSSKSIDSVYWLVVRRMYSMPCRCSIVQCSLHGMAWHGYCLLCCDKKIQLTLWSGHHNMCDAVLDSPHDSFHIGTHAICLCPTRPGWMLLTKHHMIDLHWCPKLFPNLIVWRPAPFGPINTLPPHAPDQQKAPLGVR